MSPYHVGDLNFLLFQKKINEFFVKFENSKPRKAHLKCILIHIAIDRYPIPSKLQSGSVRIYNFSFKFYYFVSSSCWNMIKCDFLFVVLSQWLKNIYNSWFFIFFLKDITVNLAVFKMYLWIIVLRVNSYQIFKISCFQLNLRFRLLLKIQKNKIIGSQYRCHIYINH